MFRNLSIFTRLVILIIVMLFAFLVNIYFSWGGLQLASNSLTEVFEGSVNEITALNNLRYIYAIDILDSAHKVRNGTMNWKDARIKVENSLDRMDSLLAMYLQHLPEGGGEDEFIRTQSENLKHQVNATKPVIKKLLNIIVHQDKEELATMDDQELYLAMDPPRIIMHQLINHYADNTKKDYEKSMKEITAYKKLLIFVFILALIPTLLIAWLITRSITRPLTRAIEEINKVSLGDLTTRIDAEDRSKNEIGRLYEAMHQMLTADKKIVEALSKLTKGDLSISIQPRGEYDALGLAMVTMAKRLRQMIGSLQSEVISLTNSSQEIVNSVSQVAIGSSETATAVTETTTTVEELKQTAQVSAEKARDVLASAEDTLRVVKESEKSLQSTIYDMNQINEKMRSISEGIIKLSELSQTIGEIIDSVNDLAEQSNLLAVNAAIEAAKAGEQGKGFGVVAQEIRTLAEQSKAATVQVRSILNDIQNATSAAVLATEQGSKAVEKGVDQSSQTNESMRILVTSMGHVTQAANQISISSQQQLVAVDQVNIAMNNINEATRQHIENMRTIENAVTAFNAIGQALKQITDQYTLTDEQKRNSQIENEEDIFSHRS